MLITFIIMAGVSRKTIQLFYDVVSPYSWIGFEVRDEVHRLAQLSVSSHDICDNALSDSP